MNFACSTCLESLTPKSDVSSTPCGHVYHTVCIEKWLSNGQNNCSQCRKACTKDKIIKLFFSESDSENSLISEIKAENEKLKMEANESKSKQLKYQDENMTSLILSKLKNSIACTAEAKSGILKGR